MNTNSMHSDPQGTSELPAGAPRDRRTSVSEAQIYAERIRLLYQSPVPALANLAVGTLLVVVAWGHVSEILLVGWVLAMAAVTAVRVVLWKAFAARPLTTADAALWERRIVVSVTVSDSLWLLSGLPIAFGHLPVYVVGIVPVTVAGMLAGAIFALTPSDRAFRLYTIIAALGPILGFLAVGDRLHVAVAGMGCVYLLVVLLWGRDASRTIESAIRLRLENQALVQDLAAVREGAEMAERLKRESFANLGHELRTPLNAIIGFAQSLDAELWGPLGNPRYRDYAKAIADSGQHLYVLIQDILDLSRHDAGILELDETTVDLAAAVQTCRKMLSGSAAANGVSLTVRVPDQGLWVTGDSTKLRQIVINLAANAIRFTPAGGRVTVGACRLDSGETELRVEDTGIGLNPEDIPRALEPFVQVSRDQARGTGGAGLGLPLSQRLAALHGGVLEIHSQRGTGTVVRVVLPAGRAAEQPRRPSPNGSELGTQAPRK